MGRKWHVYPVFEYARTTQKSTRPLIMAGFDCQFSAYKNAEHYAEALPAFLDKQGTEVGKSFDSEARETLKAMTAALVSGEYNPSAAEREKYRTVVSAASAALAKAPAGEETAFFSGLSKTWKSLSRCPHRGTDLPPKTAGIRQWRTICCIWCVSVMRVKKIIVWAASYHLMHDPKTIDTQNPQIDYKNTSLWERLFGKRLAAMSILSDLLLTGDGSVILLAKVSLFRQRRRDLWRRCCITQGLHFGLWTSGHFPEVIGSASP
jgi:hypothetical protein